MDYEKQKSDTGIKVTIVEIEDGLAQETPRTRKCFQSLGRSFKRRCRSDSENGSSPWIKLLKRVLVFLSVTGVCLGIAYITHHAVLASLIRRLSPMVLPQNGLTAIVDAWVEPGTVTPAPPSWRPDFSRDIQPKPIHSHNDYWRRVPLFDSLSVGITAVEADCHLVGDEIFVGHQVQSLRRNRTFNSLYLDPLFEILENQNMGKAANDPTKNGVWDVDPSRGFILMTDLKTEGHATLNAVQKQLDRFRENGWLTYWNGTDIVPGPLLHIGTGNTPFKAILESSYSNSTYRDVFFDAPLDALSDAYNITNSYYSSTSLTKLFGSSKIPRSGLTKSQIKVVHSQIEKATNLGLVTRYWDIPAWPIETRTKIWRQLEQAQIGMLNVDAIDLAARWNWRLCNILGMNLC
ncbi:PLC-like phosphodiesterase [Glarea lozoyensis ATCC 20868]|uniref:Altered inheritance of mitochondria protein 6 n=1 Tax=Glarea lozoyensis (strain ATCC 20868 / MF5171) TaxID=1116229 RepID=S3D6T2_GLAL2|nr:PLC-like phosphodiesterase [Glarea lozoyensis ATCC 20868]EPE32814.1 PLC-like phosphodiesterase [Glarea lozoyensis ATCC 20868]